jgi:hypothetical protein
MIKEVMSLFVFERVIKDNSKKVISFNHSSYLVLFVLNHGTSAQQCLDLVHEVSMKMKGSLQFSQNSTPQPCPEQVLNNSLPHRTLLLGEFKFPSNSFLGISS